MVAGNDLDFLLQFQSIGVAQIGTDDFVYELAPPFPKLQFVFRVVINCCHQMIATMSFSRIGRLQSRAIRLTRLVTQVRAFVPTCRR